MRPAPFLLVLALLGGGCAESAEPGSVPDTSRDAGWTRLAESPLSPRELPVAAVVDGRAVFVGGSLGPPCPPTADCVRGTHARDGAAYDLRAGSWAPIADAPRPVLPVAPHAVVGDHLFVLDEGGLLDYDAARDRWSTVSVPAFRAGHFSLTSYGDRLVVYPGSEEAIRRPDRVLDPATRRWSTLPDDGWTSYDRVITPTVHGLVLTSKAMVFDRYSGDQPPLVRAAVLAPGADAWRRLPTSDQLGGGRWSWTGRRLLDATLGGADGGEVNGYGRTIPYGGVLDPATGQWSRLPNAPKEGSGGWPVDAARGPVTAGAGWVYDDRSREWTRLGRPPGAPPDPGSAVWVGDTLLVLGGTDWSSVNGMEAAEPGDVWSTGLWAHRLTR